MRSRKDTCAAARCPPRRCPSPVPQREKPPSRGAGLVRPLDVLGADREATWFLAVPGVDPDEGLVGNLARTRDVGRGGAPLLEGPGLDILLGPLVEVLTQHVGV